MYKDAYDYRISGGIAMMVLASAHVDLLEEYL
jgi:hypothetical protein